MNNCSGSIDMKHHSWTLIFYNDGRNNFLMLIIILPFYNCQDFVLGFLALLVVEIVAD